MRWRLYEEIIGTLIIENLPEGIKAAVRTQGPINLEDLLRVVWEAEQSSLGLLGKNTAGAEEA